MELFQVLQKNMPQRKKVFDRFQKKGHHDLSKFLLQLIKNVKKENHDLNLLNAFFIELYDMSYHYILFDEIKVAKKVVKLLEELALPIKYIGVAKRKETLNTIKKIKI